MIAAARTFLVLLAAGRAVRFGSDKLSADWRGQPIGSHAATMLACFDFLGRVAVVGSTALDYAALGYRVTRNPAPEAGMSGSIRLGIAAAIDAGADAALIALADMPCVTAAHIRRLLDAADGAEAVVASSDGRQPMPPVVFGSAHFAALSQLEGSGGARALIRGGRHIVAGARELIDIDTRDDLARLPR